MKKTLALLAVAAMMFTAGCGGQKQAEDAAKAIESAIDKTLDDGYRTADIFSEGFKKVGTEEVTEIICDRL